MAGTPQGHPPVGQETEALPFVAPCRSLPAGAPLHWLRLGWEDLRGAPRLSLAYGAAVVALSYLISVLAFTFGGYILLLSLLSGFIFIGPVLAIGLYSVSRQAEQGRSPRLADCLREERRHLGNAMVFALILLVVFLLWVRAASMVHVFFPVEANPGWAGLAVFLGVGTVVGSVFAAVVFCASAFSLPMIMDRRVDVVTAVVTSTNAVLRNKTAMALWAGLIVVCVAVGFATAFLGLAIVLPLIGYASWHAYRDTVIADAWPRFEEGPS
jgi:uncharacterized membrane protein